MHDTLTLTTFLDCRHLNEAYTSSNYSIHHLPGLRYGTTITIYPSGSCIHACTSTRYPPTRRQISSTCVTPEQIMRQFHAFNYSDSCATCMQFAQPQSHVSHPKCLIGGLSLTCSILQHMAWLESVESVHDSLSLLEAREDAQIRRWAKKHPTGRSKRDVICCALRP